MRTNQIIILIMSCSIILLVAAMLYTGSNFISGYSVFSPIKDNPFADSTGDELFRGIELEAWNLTEEQDTQNVTQASSKNSNTILAKTTFRLLGSSSNGNSDDSNSNSEGSGGGASLSSEQTQTQIQNQIISDPVNDQNTNFNVQKNIPTGVPEFPSGGLLMAVLAGCLGLAYMRKKD